MTVEGHTILLVDDNDDLREVTVELLEALGHRVFDAMGARSAFRAFEDRTDEIDLVVIEFVLPTMDGLELADRLRARRPGLGVLLTSTHDNHRDLRARVDRGELAFLRKPYSGEELAAKIEEAVATEATDPDSAASETGTEMKKRSTDVSGTSTAFQRASAGRRAPRDDRPTERRRRRDLLDLGRTVAVGLLVFGLFFTLYLASQRPPPLPERVPDSVFRGTVVEPISPVGEIRAVPRELRWRPVKNAHHYEARLLAVDESTIWRGSTKYPRLVLPEKLRERLHPRVVYFWMIEAFDENGSRLSGSERVSFLVGDPRASS